MNPATLLTQYEEKHPQRALGGVRALAGFEYQLRVYLAEFVEALAAGGHDPGDPDEFLPCRKL